MNKNNGILPVFYTREHEDYKGSKVALWENTQETAPGQKPCHYEGKIGEASVKLWKAKGPAGVFFNIKREIDGQLEPFGAAVAYTRNGFNALSISLKFSSIEAAEAAQLSLGIKEQPKPWKDVFFINVFADVSKTAVQANPEIFGSMGFLVGDVAIRARKKSP